MPGKMLLVFSSQNSSRLAYILQLLLKDLLKIDFEYTDNKEKFLNYTGPKLSYGTERLDREVHIHAMTVLFEKTISVQSIAAGEWQGVKTLFHHDRDADLPFDLLAASFYLVTRYEEYLPFSEDTHGRFPVEQSIAYKNGFSEIPVVDHYAQFLKKILQEKNSGLNFPPRKYAFQLTYDIDMAFAFREKGAMRNAAGYLRSLKNLNLKEISLRTRVLLGATDDPFDTFVFQQWLHEQYKLKPVYFFLLGDHGPFDKNISWRNVFFTDIVKALSEKNETGIHSSYDSNRYPKKVKIEKERLEKITGKPVFRNRQHFLKLRFPETYRNLLDAGITEDYTMGYAEQPGFRVGISIPFKWYDLEKEEATSLTVHPFAVMDASLHYYQNLDPVSALEKSKLVVDAVKRVNGHFIFLAHNDLLSDEGPWKGWREQFEKLLAYAATDASSSGTE
jgi:hypothetical protein